MFVYGQIIFRKLENYYHKSYFVSYYPSEAATQGMKYCNLRKITRRIVLFSLTWTMATKIKILLQTVYRFRTLFCSYILCQ